MMWLAVDADGVILAGAFRGHELFGPRCPDMHRARDQLRALQHHHLVRPGFTEAVTAHAELWGGAAAEVLERNTRVELDTGVLDEIDRCRDRFSGIALATNQTSERLHAVKMRLPQGFFDVIIASCDVGAAKPERRFFELLAERLAVPLEDVLFVDDRAENVKGAVTAGMLGAEFPRLGGRQAMAAILNDHYESQRRPKEDIP